MNSADAVQCLVSLVELGRGEEAVRMFDRLMEDSRDSGGLPDYSDQDQFSLPVEINDQGGGK